jgi:hypothetical protein
MSMSRFLRSRRGLTLNEFIGCLGAVAGGVWISSQYFNVDVHRVAYTALDESELLKQIPEQFRPTNPECPNGDCSEVDLSPEERRRRLRAELIRLRQDVVALTLPSSTEDATDHPDDHLRQATLDYWLQVRGVISEVAALQAEAEQSLSKQNAALVLNVRLRAFHYGHRSIRAIIAENVDQEAQEVGVRIAEWFEHGSAMYQEASDLWNGRQAGQSTASDQRWDALQRQHLKEADFLREKSAAVGSLLALRYAADFPNLGL